MRLTLLHTADAHNATFDALRDHIAPDLSLHHQVRPDWLKRAQTGIGHALREEIQNEIKAASDPMICTCTTIGPTAEAAGAVRVDWPMMQKAAQTGGPIVMAYALDSTWEPSLALLERALAEQERQETVHPFPLTQYWPLFEAGETDAFAAVVAGEIRQLIMTGQKIGCIVLAQVSMAGAAPLLKDLDVPVLSSPELALKFAIDQQTGQF